MNNKEKEKLRNAIAISPDNIALRLLFAGMLSESKEYPEAEKEFRHILSKNPENTEAKTGLAEVFLQQAKTSQALVILEELMKQQSAPSHLVLYAKALFAANENDKAREHYRTAIAADANVKDLEFEHLLGIRTSAAAEKTEPEDKIRMPADEYPADIEIPVEKPQISFADVGGMEKLKEEIRMKIVYPLENPEIFRSYGKKTGGGILLYGPPGCGKTFISKATAGEVKARFVMVGIHEIVDMWYGQSEKNLHSVFETARQNKPCILFFDEIDALGTNRVDAKHSAGRTLINQFLSELDGTQDSNEGILTLGATNAPWHLDKAFLRPGRFDRIIFVPPPDQKAREAILQIITKDKPLLNLDFSAVAKKTDKFSSADLISLVEKTAEKKIGEALRSKVPKPISTKDILGVVSETRTSTSDWFLTAKNYVLYSNQSGLYDEVAKYLRLK